MRYCIFCGAEIPEDAEFCQICGKKQPGDDSVKKPEASDKTNELKTEPPTGLAAIMSSPKKMLIAGAGAFIALLIIMTVIMLLVLKE